MATSFKLDCEEMKHDLKMLLLSEEMVQLNLAKSQTEVAVYCRVIHQRVPASEETIASLARHALCIIMWADTIIESHNVQ